MKGDPRGTPVSKSKKVRRLDLGGGARPYFRPKSFRQKPGGKSGPVTIIRPAIDSASQQK